MQIEVSKDEILAMSDEEIHRLLWDCFGLAVDPSWSRQRLLSELVRRATEVIEQ